MYTPNFDIDQYIKLNFVSVKCLINMCFTSKKEYDWCRYQDSWISAFKYDQLPLYAPYPTTIKDWIKRYEATIKMLNILKMHNLYLSHFNKEAIIDDNEQMLSVYNLDTYYETLYTLPLPESILSNLKLNVDDIKLVESNFNIYTYTNKIDIVYNGEDNKYVTYSITKDELLYILIKITEETNLRIKEDNGIPFDKQDLIKLYKKRKDKIIKERLDYINSAY